MDERSLRVLEWKKIKSIIAELASFSLGKEMVMALEPTTNYHEVVASLNLTTQALNLLWKHSEPPFGGANDVSAVLKRAQIGGVLDGGELLQVARLLYCCGHMRQYLAESDSFDDYIVQLVQNPQLVARINRCIDDDGSVRDSASSQLASIRQKMRSLASRVRDRLDSIVHSQSNHKLLQDNVVTLRNGRYVVPVKQEYRTRFGGIVHDQSASGQTLFIEPAVVVELNNQLRLTQQDEQKEVERILCEITQFVAQEAVQLHVSLNALSELDMVFAKAKYSRKINGMAAKINDYGYVYIKQGRHPLLSGNVVPVNLWIGDEFDILVITGPNTGGKTVTLKTLGLFAIMTQAGLHIPAQDGSEMPIYDNIFADIGDEQSIEQSLSTFSSHMSNIVKILQKASEHSLVLLDELGAGTDPTEGAALAMAILEFLREREITAIATTHYSELKNFAYANAKVENASVEFDLQTLKPTYHLAIGVPGKSNAFAIATRLGLNSDIVGYAQGLLSEERVHSDDIINEMEANRREARIAREESERLKEEYHRLKQQYDLKYKELTETREQLIEQAKDDAVELVNTTRQDLDLLIGELRKQQNIDLEQVVQEKRARLVEQQKQFQAQKTASIQHEPPRQLKVGEQVRIRSLNQVGHVVEITDQDALIQAGILRVNAKLTDLERVSEGAPAIVVKQTPKSKETRGQSKSISIKPEIDLRGQTVDEALAVVDKYLDDAFLSSLNQVRIIHGKGTGALREAIHVQLRAHVHVKSYRLADPQDGGSGATVVELNA